MDEMCGTPAKKPTTIAQRFGGFATAHSVYSLLCWGIMLGPFGPVLEFPWDPLVWLLPMTAMLLYFPLGMFTARMSGWTPPRTGREKGMAVLLPMLVAWAWVGIVLVSIAGEWEALFMGIFAISFLFAAPSSIFAILCMGGVSRLTGGGGLILSLGLSGLLAGLLPPLLFALGSFYQAGRQGKRTVVTEGEING